MCVYATTRDAKVGRCGRKSLDGREEKKSRDDARDVTARAGQGNLRPYRTQYLMQCIITDAI